MHVRGSSTLQRTEGAGMFLLSGPGHLGTKAGRRRWPMNTHFDDMITVSTGWTLGAVSETSACYAHVSGHIGSERPIRLRPPREALVVVRTW